MKKIKIILTLTLAVFCMSASTAQTTEKKKATKKVKPAATQYQCLMKCEGTKVYSTAGKCPKCGMNLKAIAKPATTLMYQCPMKCEGDKLYAEKGKCPKCNMKLKKTATINHPLPINHQQ